MKECAGKTDPAACSADIAKVVAQLGIATTDISKAVKDCSGSGSPCATDIGNTVTALGNAVTMISQAVDDFKTDHKKAEQDVISAGKDILSGVAAVKSALADCKKGTTTLAAAAVNGDPCNGKLRDATSCNANDLCTWCVNSAVPSACYQITDATGLPCSIFNCTKTCQAKMLGNYIQ